jgi:hypothetical protein
VHERPGEVVKERYGLITPRHSFVAHEQCRQCAEKGAEVRPDCTYQQERPDARRFRTNTTSGLTVPLAHEAWLDWPIRMIRGEKTRLGRRATSHLTIAKRKVNEALTLLS